MNTNNFNQLAKLHKPTPVIILQDLKYLEKFKTSDKIVVAGNGPSLTEYLDTTDVSQWNMVGTSALSMCIHKPTFLFFESISTLGGKDLNIGSLDQIILDYSIQVLITNHLANLQSSVFPTVLLNPQFALFANPLIHPYLNPLLSKHKIFIPPYFFINEATDNNILTSLSRFIASPLACILNFRGSIIRALSLSYFLGYKRIDIVGIDPSSPHYWYTNSDKYLDHSLPPALKHLLSVKHSLADTQYLPQRTQHEGELLKQTNFTLSYSICFSIAVLDKHFTRLGNRNLPSITWHSKDPLIYSFISSLGLKSRVNLEYSGI